LVSRRELASAYRDLLPAMPPHEWRRVRGEQEIVVRYEPDKALATLPRLLSDPADRERLVTLVRRLLADERVQRAKPSAEQMAIVDRIGTTLRTGAPKGIARKVRKSAARRRTARANA
jgi:3-polyprenyl-4-hydroxybenzoate decarboxylase